jgi:hypothetical protein
MRKVALPPDIRDVADKADSKDAQIVDRPFDADKVEAIWLFWTRMFFLGLAAVCTAGIIVVYLLHLAISPRWRWLSPSDLTRIEGLAITIIVGLVMSGATTYFFKKKN